MLILVPDILTRVHNVSGSAWPVEFHSFLRIIFSKQDAGSLSPWLRSTHWLLKPVYICSFEASWFSFVCFHCFSIVAKTSHIVKDSLSVQSLSRVWLFVTPWITARQASLCITNSWSLLRLKSIKSVMPSSHLILCCTLLLLPPIPPSIRVFSSESTLRMRWPKYWEFQLQHQSFQWWPSLTYLY